MKIYVLRTYTIDCNNKVRSLSCIGHQLKVAEYDNRPHERHSELIEEAREFRPQVIVYIGAIEQYHGKPCIQIDNMKRLRDIAPTIHLCGDASDSPWWPLLEDFDRNDCFAAQVNIDGNHESPIERFRNGLTLLTPIDVTPFKWKDWQTRKFVGTSGNSGGDHRVRLMNRMFEYPGFEWLRTNDAISYDAMADYMCGLKIIVNSPQNGSQTGFHVKGRVVETGFAGACLLEAEDSPTKAWFKPNVDYLTYKDFDHAASVLDWAKQNDDLVCDMATEFHHRCWNLHHPQVFWDKVFVKAGLTWADVQELAG